MRKNIPNYKFEYCEEVYNHIMKSNILNDKEKECFQYLVKGWSGEKIAKKLNCGIATIWNRRRTITHKLTEIPKEYNEKYSIYILIFPNGKYYIGKSINPIKRWNNGDGYITNKEMYIDIKNYGWENIEKKILYKNLTADEAKQKENETIVIYRSYMKEYGYNNKIIS